ncbi:hypothetical protein BCR43DRAFT_118482 [Syncephalastrum racemosum]|uniref:Uncharacterized protein n=1 Tax=Syncephalastrum racemosum TaxID=13706 RepID=A0A1X2GZN2_SYNRA|nr:hypothetical protein BCR43DRAFT_118482 [Syncephalastrum racemosum]
MRFTFISLLLATLISSALSFPLEATTAGSQGGPLSAPHDTESSHAPQEKEPLQIDCKILLTC